MIDQQVIDSIIDQTSIIDVIGEFVTLKKRGQNYIGLCPFHNEKTASFTVAYEKGFYKCFGCGKSGSSAGFLMEHEGMSFPEAIEYLGKRLGIEVKSEPGKKPVNLQAVQDFFVKKGIVQVEAYMRLRQFKKETYEFFGVGYSPRENIISMQSKNKELMLKYGVIGQSNGMFYDRFRGRHTFPIHSVSGNVVGWTGRSESSKPKYVNSPQSEIYDKSKTLFGIFHAKHWIKHEDNCYIVEGPTDVMRLWEKEIRNVVATNGTALTPDQCRLIHRFTDNVTLLYDGDAAGHKATDSAIPIILSEGMNARVVLLPQGDPEEYFRTGSMPVSMDWIDYYVYDGDVKDPVYISMVANDTLKMIGMIPDEIKKILYVRKLSSMLGIPEKSLGHRISLKTGDVKKEDVSALHIHEKHLIWLLVYYGDVMLPVDDGEKMTDMSVASVILDDLQKDEIKFSDPVFEKISQEILSGSLGLRKFIDHEDPIVSSLVIGMMNNDVYDQNANIKTLIRDVEHSILSLKAIYVDKIKQNIQQRILQAQNSQDKDECLRLMNLEADYHKLYVGINNRMGRIIGR